MAKFKVGDIIAAITDEYGVTTLRNKWEGRVTKIATDEYFHAVTTKSLDLSRIGVRYEYLRECNFELVTEPTTGTVRVDCSQDSLIKKTFMNIRDLLKSTEQKLVEKFILTSDGKLDEKSEAWQEWQFNFAKKNGLIEFLVKKEAKLKREEKKSSK